MLFKINPELGWIKISKHWNIFHQELQKFSPPIFSRCENSDSQNTFSTTCGTIFSWARWRYISSQECHVWGWSLPWKNVYEGIWAPQSCPGQGHRKMSARNWFLSSNPENNFRSLNKIVLLTSFVLFLKNILVEWTKFLFSLARLNRSI